MYFYASGESPAALAYKGRKQAPYFHYKYPSAESRDLKVSEKVDYLQRLYEASEARRLERKQFKTTLSIGDILYESWGYDQTNVDFHEVTDIKSAKTVVTRQVSKKHISANADSNKSSEVVANPGDYIDDEVVRRVKIGNLIKIHSSSIASPWDGKPKYCSWYA